jgi:organic hydroperoxide reductase OsmC/OhrA
LKVEVLMRSSARIHNSQGEHDVKLTTGERTSKLEIPPKASGAGSSATGGELLMLALATCYCNDLYREAAKMGIRVTHVDVECSAEFPAEGEPARDITCAARITADAPEERVRELVAEADRLAEIHNTIRSAVPVTMGRVEVEAQA